MSHDIELPVTIWKRPLLPSESSYGSLEAGPYRLRNGCTGEVFRVASYEVAGTIYRMVEGTIDGNPVGWNLDGSHSYGNYVPPGHPPFDLMSRIKWKTRSNGG